MALAKPQFFYTVEQYLELERKSEDRHEYLDGQIYAMAGESGEHGDICTNLVGILHAQLRGKPCRARSKDTKVRSGPNPKRRSTTEGLYSYPDIVVICGGPQYHDQCRDVILNPAVIIEVLSESTETFDRGEKFHRYQTWNPTLTDYLLVSQSYPRVEHYVRQTDGSWSYHLYQGLEQNLAINSIDCTLRLAEVYDRIVFPEETTEPPVTE